MVRLVLFSVFIVAAVSGCATEKISDREQKTEVSVLAKNLCGLSSSVNTLEAFRAADTAVRYPLLLSEEWRVTPPAAFNNTLINVGIHSRGLCYQWADALTVKLMTLHLHTLEIHRGVAKLGTRREHSCVVLTAPGQNFTNGIALDAWRHCGKLNWSPVATDKYTWQEVDLPPLYQAELRAAAGKLGYSFDSQ